MTCMGSCSVTLPFELCKAASHRKGDLLQEAEINRYCSRWRPGGFGAPKLRATRWELQSVSRATTCIFLSFLSLISFYVVQEKIQKILLSFWNKVLFCRMFVLLLERDRSVIQLDKVQYLDYLAEFIIMQMCCLSLYFSVIQVKHQKIWLLL